ncbi:ornithine cyclodeaminase family protein [Rubrobacter indicoceani]|uniref:ornithine cyclodeaminase family protein n=1 Tax=Rubrobacter indicoceani TaxID=2051957 RepID=UPI0013C420FB|nr:ornithine cyclodeaminase family protein [Rubrobacter indicoceani]
MTRLITEAEVSELLDLPTTLVAVEAVFRQHGEGLATNRSRRRAFYPGGQLNVMFGATPEIDAAGTKAYTISRNGAKFYTLLFDPAEGDLLAIIQSDRMGQLRTGAATGVGTRYLARDEAATLGLFGTGWQAESQLEAVAAVRDLTRVLVYSRTEENRRKFAEKMSGRLDLEVETTDSPEEAAAQDIVVTMTSSREPVLKGEWLRPGTHVTAAGSNSLLKAEIDREVVRRADFVCVDSKEEVGLEAGDLLPAMESGVITTEAVYELGAVVAGLNPGRRTPEDITLFCSQGLAIQDMAVARIVYDLAVKNGTGREVDF